MKLFIAWAGDHVLRELDRMAMRSDAEGIRRATRSIERGNETIKSWLEATDGQIISMDNAGGRAQMQADYLHELEGMRDRYREIVGAAASVGIGSAVAEAEIALKAARLRGGDRALIFTPQMQDELSQNADKLPLLDKSEGVPIEQAIASFAKENRHLQEPTKARFECAPATAMFNRHLDQHGYPGARMASIPAYMLPTHYGDKPNATHYAHVATEHNGKIYDWTARQYNPHAPFPLVYDLSSLPEAAQQYVHEKSG